MAAIRPRATYSDALRVIEAMDIDLTVPVPKEYEQPKTVEECKEWLDQMIADHPIEKRREDFPRVHGVAMHEIPTNETAANTEELDNICGICHQTLVDGEDAEMTPIKLMACNHAFHYECLQCFFDSGRSSKCPYCRTEILFREPDPAWWLEDLLDWVDEEFLKDYPEYATDPHDNEQNGEHDDSALDQHASDSEDLAD